MLKPERACGLTDFAPGPSWSLPTGQSRIQLRGGGGQVGSMVSKWMFWGPARVFVPPLKTVQSGGKKARQAQKTLSVEEAQAQQGKYWLSVPTSGWDGPAKSPGIQLSGLSASLRESQEVFCATFHLEKLCCYI